MMKVIIFSGSSIVFATSLLAATLGPNARDIAESVAAYDLRIGANGISLNIPGAEVNNLEAGQQVQGSVTGVVAYNVNENMNYAVTFHAAVGKMNQVIDGSFYGLGLYREKNIEDIGGVLSHIRLYTASNQAIPVQIDQNNQGGCRVENNIVLFYGGTGDLSLCSIMIHGSELQKISEAAPGNAQYSFRLSANAQSNNVYSNELSYRISAVQP